MAFLASGSGVNKLHGNARWFRRGELQRAAAQKTEWLAGGACLVPMCSTITTLNGLALSITQLAGATKKVTVMTGEAHLVLLLFF